MVKETKKIHIIDLVSKFFHCEKQDFNEKITDFLDEICGYFKLEWLEARSLIDHRIYRIEFIEFIKLEIDSKVISCDFGCPCGQKILRQKIEGC